MKTKRIDIQHQRLAFDGHFKIEEAGYKRLSLV